MDTQTARAPTSEVLDGLNDLLQLDHDAVGAYDIAMEKLEDRDHATQIAGYRRDHERHIRELNELITELGGTPKNEPHATGPFKEALQSLGQLGGDKGLLIAWRTNELAVRTKYDSYAQKANAWPANVKRVIDGAALDEERHYSWVADVLQRMGVGSGEGMETDLANRARERAAASAATGSSIGARLDDAKEKVREIADQARSRVTELAETARERAATLPDTARDRAGAVMGAVPGRVADGLDAAASRLRERGGTAERVAGGLGSSAEYLRTHEPAQMGTDARVGVENRVRQSPVQTLLIAAFAGFVIGRLLR